MNLTTSFTHSTHPSKLTIFSSINTDHIPAIKLISLMADFARTSTNNSLPGRPLGRFLSQGHYSFNIALMPATSNNFPQEQPAATNLQTVLAFIMSSILSLTELKYQGKEISPFDKHPVLMSVSVACLLTYWLAYVIEFARFINFSSLTKVQAIHCVMILLGSLSVGSSASIIFLDSVQLSFFFLYTLLTLCALFHSQLKLPYRMIPQMILAKLFGASYPQERRVRGTSTDTHWLLQRNFVSHRNMLPL